jgi:hypothetical protein
MTEPDPVRIVRVTLKPESYMTYRAAHGGDRMYPIVLTLSRPLSVYALLELGRNSPFYVDSDNPQEVELLNFELEALRQRFAELEAAIMTADSRGRQVQQQAEAEDSRLKALRDEINSQIEQSNRQQDRS